MTRTFAAEFRPIHYACSLDDIRHSGPVPCSRGQEGLVSGTLKQYCRHLTVASEAWPKVVSICSRNAAALLTQGTPSEPASGVLEDAVHIIKFMRATDNPVRGYVHFSGNISGTDSCAHAVQRTLHIGC
jgi:hypothetical protein